MFHNLVGSTVQFRKSSISGLALTLTLGMAAVALSIAAATELRFAGLPNLMPSIAGIFIVDLLSKLAPPTPLVRPIQALVYGLLYIEITCFCGVLAAYATQRFGFPLQDQLFVAADHAIRIDWFDFVYWVDSHPILHTILELAYNTISVQVVLPAVILALSDRIDDLQRYLLGFAIALALTIAIATFLPAASPIALVDHSTFHALRFYGATPIDHLMQLRSAGPVTIAGDLGGIISFPSFHATVAILTPLTLWRYRGPLFVLLLILNTMMLISTITDGAHYAVDIPAGCLVAIVAFLLSKRIAPAERDGSIPSVTISPLQAIEAWAGRPKRMPALHESASTDRQISAFGTPRM